MKALSPFTFALTTTKPSGPKILPTYLAQEPMQMAFARHEPSTAAETTCSTSAVRGMVWASCLSAFLLYEITHSHIAYVVDISSRRHLAVTVLTAFGNLINCECRLTVWIKFTIKHSFTKSINLQLPTNFLPKIHMHGQIRTHAHRLNKQHTPSIHSYINTNRIHPRTLHTLLQICIGYVRSNLRSLHFNPNLPVCRHVCLNGWMLDASPGVSEARSEQPGNNSANGVAYVSI